MNFCLVFAYGQQATKQTPQEYIEKYKDLAVIEMHRSGVPASITLAQGILESNSGNSRLARYANNHFGIKCKGDWTGDVIYADDDEPNECFRAYNSVLESYKDHSEFLRNNWRYHPLFELDRTDYIGWSRGLKKAGYATNPKYHTILINLIERYELQMYDLMPLPNVADPSYSETINDVPIVVVQNGQTVESIAQASDLRARHIRKWNDLEEDEQLTEGDIVYLKPKRRKAQEATHVVAEGEDMRDISQQYGIKLKQLYKKNRMETGTQPAVGETIYMRSKRDKEDSIQLAQPIWYQAEEAFVNPHSVRDSSAFEKADPIEKTVIEVPEYHVVVKGDNIYRIAERYHVFEEDLMNWNPDLDPGSLAIGQKIYLSKEAADAYYQSPAYLNSKVQDRKDSTKVESNDEQLSDEEVEQLEQDIPVSGPVFHMVVKGDTVYNICKRYGITADQLKSWNKMTDNSIQIGQKLQVSE